MLERDDQSSAADVLMEGSHRLATCPPRMTDTSDKPFALAHWLPYRFSVVANRVSASLYAFYQERYGMSVPAWRVMAHLGESQPLSAKDVAEMAAMDSVSVTRALNQLESLGLLIRKIDPEDRRRVTLKLSKKGQAAYDEIVPLAQEAQRALLEGLNATERAALDKLSAKIWKNSEALA